jgi:hypothetical protein
MRILAQCYTIFGFLSELVNIPISGNGYEFDNNLDYPIIAQLLNLEVPIYEVKKESNLKGLENSDNPWDQGKNIVGLDNKNREIENKFEKLRKEIEKE